MVNFWNQLFVVVTLVTKLAETAPNILVILADDMGYHDVGFHDPTMVTPNINKLREEGIFLSNSYAYQKCTPSRASLLTGIYAPNMGISDVFFAGLNNSLPINQTVFPQVLKQNRYKNHYVGKWHLGFCRPEMTPTYKGFDTFYGTYNGLTDYYDHSKQGLHDLHDNVGNDTSQWRFDEANRGQYLTDLYTERAVDIINNHDKRQPLLLFLSHYAVHGPVQVKEDQEERCSHINDTLRRKFCALAASMDEGIGKVMDAMKQRKLDKNLITLFMSDNGGDFKTGSSNYPFRGGKVSLFEGGTKVVTILHSAKKLPVTGPNTTWSGMMHAVDWFPTLLKSAGIAYSGKIDGKNNWFRIRKNKTSTRTEFLYNYLRINENITFAALRYNQWKLVENWAGYPSLYTAYNPSDTREPADAAGRPRKMEDPYLLFDLDNDKRETTNVYAQMKDKNPPLIQLLKDKMAAYKNSTIDESTTFNYRKITIPETRWDTNIC